MDSMLSDGCILEAGARVENSVLSPGVIVRAGAVVRQAIFLTDSIVGPGAVVERAILDKCVQVFEYAIVGSQSDRNIVLAGKNSQIPAGATLLPGATIANDVVLSDYSNLIIDPSEVVQTTRKPNEI